MYFRFTPKSVVERVASKLSRDEVNNWKKGCARQHGKRKNGGQFFPRPGVLRLLYQILTTYNTHKYAMRYGGVKMVVVHRYGQRYIHMHWGQCTASCPEGWEGGSLIPLWDVIRQMHTIGRMVSIYTTPGIVGYLFLWKYSCFISGTENNSNLSYKQRRKTNTLNNFQTLK